MSAIGVVLNVNKQSIKKQGVVALLFSYFLHPSTGESFYFQKRAVNQKMKKQNINKTEMAKKMNTSRAALDRLLNPYNDSVTLSTLTKAANVLGKKLVLQLQ